MPITFTPSLGESVSIKVPVVPTRHISTPSSWLVRNDEQAVTRQGAVDIKFAARLSSEEYRRLGEGKVQVWSDFPRTDGELGNVWGEVDFQLDSDADVKEGEVALTYTFSIPIPTASTSTFTFQPQSYSFTYRIVSSNGSVQWLGAYGQNGGVKVEFEEDTSSDADETLSVDLVGSCWGRQGKGSCIWFPASDAISASKEKVAVSLARSDKCDVWCVGKDGYSVPASTPTPLSLVIFVPVSSVESKPKDTWNPPFVQIDSPQVEAIPRGAIGFAASPEASLSLINGEVYTSGPGTVLAQFFRDGNAAEWDKLVVHVAHVNPTLKSSNSSPVSGSTLPSPTSPPIALPDVFPASFHHPCKFALATAEIGNEKDIPVLVLPSSPQTYPVRVSAAPLVPVKGKGKVRVDVDVTELIGQTEATRFVLSRGKFIDFIDTSAETKTTLIAGETTLLSPLYPFALSKSIAIAILTPHLPRSQSPSPSKDESPAASSTQAEEILPTPPPSPHLKPIAHLTVKNIARLQQESNSGGLVGNDSSASISDIGVISTSAVAAPVVTTTSVTTNASASRRGELARSISFNSGSSASGVDSDTASTVSRKKTQNAIQKRPVGLVSCFKQVFLSASFWLLILVKRLLLGGDGGAQRGRRGRSGSDSGFLNRWFGTAGSGLRSRSASASISGHSTPQRVVVDERTPMLPVVEESALQTKTDVAPQVEEPTPAPTSATTTTAPKETVVFNAMLLQSAESNHTVILCGLDSTQKPQFEVNGGSVVVVRIDQKEEGSWNVTELDWKKGGNLDVSVSF